MNYKWQSEIFSVLDHNHVSMHDLLITCLPLVHSSHRELLQHRTSNVLDLWSSLQTPEHGTELGDASIIKDFRDAFRITCQS